LSLDRRRFLQGLCATPLAASLWPLAAGAQALSVDALPTLSGRLTLYLGRGEGGLYEDVLEAIRKRNPDLELAVRRGPSVALANTLVAEARAGGPRADLFWSIDASSLGLATDAVQPGPVDDGLRESLLPDFRYRNWVPVSGRLRALAYNPDRVDPVSLPERVAALAHEESTLRIGWAPAYAAFQSFVTAMRLLEGDAATRRWLQALKPRATTYAGEFGVAMAVERGEVDLGFVNHYYVLRLLQGKPGARVALAFTRDDAGCLLNASGAAILKPSTLATDFVRYLLTREVQSYLAREAYEVPLVAGVEPPAGIPPLTELSPPDIDLERLADLRPTLDLLRQTRVL
jgi:iron(III) transport system substrate-binding protein